MANIYTGGTYRDPRQEDPYAWAYQSPYAQTVTPGTPGPTTQPPNDLSHVIDPGAIGHEVAGPAPSVNWPGPFTPPTPAPFPSMPAPPAWPVAPTLPNLPAIPQIGAAPTPNLPTFRTPAPFSFDKYQAPVPFTGPTAAEAQNDPGYTFRVQQGQQALQNWAAARGTLNDSGTAKSLEDYGQNAASQEYQNVFNRNLGVYNTNTQNALQGYLTNFNSALQGYNTNFQTQNVMPYEAGYQNAMALWQPQMAQWQAQNNANLAGYNTAANYGLAGYNTAANYGLAGYNTAANYGLEGYRTQNQNVLQQNQLNYQNALNTYTTNYQNWLMKNFGIPFALANAGGGGGLAG